MELTWYAGTFIVAFVGCIMWDLVYGPLRPQLCRKFHGWLARWTPRRNCADASRLSVTSWRMTESG